MSRLPAIIGMCACLVATATAGTPARRSWEIAGTVREALVAAPTSPGTNLLPLVFAFHGHGGSMAQAARSFALHTCWPEALVVYPQGLPTPGRLTDPAGRRAGWQSAPGNQGDRDLAFFDAMLDSLRRDFPVDPRRIYATGHSNGGLFTYLLWAERGTNFAAVAPSGAIAVREAQPLQPKPALHIAGKGDPLVRFAWQERTLQLVKRVNGCADGPVRDGRLMVYPSASGTPLAAYLYEGGHAFPPEAPAEIVRFFQGHVLPR